MQDEHALPLIRFTLQNFQWVIVNTKKNSCHVNDTALKIFAMSPFIMDNKKARYVLNLEIYKGKTSEDQHNSFNVVTKLVERYQGHGHTVLMDNNYTSVPLFFSLQASEFTAVGTVCENRKEIPNSE